MDQYWRGRSPAFLFGMIVLAAVYGWLVSYLGLTTGTVLLDGTIGVGLGLYICSHPVSNAIDLLFLDHGIMRHGSQDAHGLAWYGLNLLVMVAGWLVCVIGLTLFLS
jgi:hypothetical protein